MKRAVNGVLLLDKPPGMTSNAALQRVKRIFRAKKAGHTGSLDPLASGLLPLCLGEATKMSAWLLDADKVYEVGCRFGARTDTADADGEIVETATVPVIGTDTLAAAVARLTGEIEQVPPMYSALKHQGKRLYEFARAGVEVERPPRKITIHAIEPLEWSDEHTLGLRVRCSKGTYVRTLVEDLAIALGTLAHVAWLRRTEVGPYRVEDGACTLDALDMLAVAGDDAALDAMLLPIDSALSDRPRVDLGADAAWYLRHGQPVVVPKAPLDTLLRLYGPGERFLGVGFVQDDGRVAPKRLIQQE